VRQLRIGDGVGASFLQRRAQGAAPARASPLQLLQAQLEAARVQPPAPAPAPAPALQRLQAQLVALRAQTDAEMDAARAQIEQLHNTMRARQAQSAERIQDLEVRGSRRDPARRGR
jgi:hypothetical protein